MVMRYIGSKRLLAKKLIPIMQDDIDKASFYIEPFIGGCNMIDKIKHLQRIGVDINHYLIAMWQALQTGWQPPDNFSKEEYEALKKNPENYPPELVGFVGVGCAYSGSWFDGYANGLDSKGNPRNYCAESKRNVLKQIENMRDVKFIAGDYRQLKLPENSLIYCDPPYAAVKYYRYSAKFNSIAFWQWAIEQASIGHKIYVSEYEAPDNAHIKQVWEGEHRVYANKNKVKTAVEKLYFVSQVCK